MEKDTSAKCEGEELSLDSEVNSSVIEKEIKVENDGSWDKNEHDHEAGQKRKATPDVVQEVIVVSSTPPKPKSERKKRMRWSSNKNKADLEMLEREELEHQLQLALGETTLKNQENFYQQGFKMVGAANSNGTENKSRLKFTEFQVNISKLDLLDGDLKVGYQYSSHEIAKEAIQRYGYATNQIFVLGQRGCAKTARSHALNHIFPYSSVKFSCKHGGVYKAHRKGFVPTVRTSQTSVKTNCLAAIRMKLNRGVLEVISIDTNHNHAVNEALYNFYADIRRFSDHEKELVAEMLRSKLAPKEIAKNINEKRKERGVKGLAIAKDVLNLASSLKKAKPIQTVPMMNLTELLESLQKKDPRGFYERHGGEAIEQTTMLYIQTGEMRQLMENYSEVCYVDLMAKISSCNFGLVSIFVVDEKGFGQPACLGFFRDDDNPIFSAFCQTFKTYNPGYAAFNTMVIRRNFSLKQILESEFSDCKILYNVTSVVTCVKNVLLKDTTQTPEQRKSLVHMFENLMHSKSIFEFEANEQIFLSFCNEHTRGYYEKKLKKEAEMWCYAHRDREELADKPLRGHTEKFLNLIRSTLVTKKSRPSLKDCVTSVLQILGDQTSKNVGMSESQRRYFHVPNGDTTIALVEAEMDATLTMFGASVIRGQLSIFLKEFFTIEFTNEGVWNVSAQNMKENCQVSSTETGYACSCHIYQGLRITCRHIFAVRKSREEPLFHLGDISSHWQEAAEVPTVATKSSTDLIQFSSRSSKPDFAKQGDRLRCLRDITGKLYCEMSKLKNDDFSVHFNFIKAYTSYLTNPDRCVIEEIAKSMNELIETEKTELNNLQS